MEEHEEARIKARKNIQIADHMVYVTYNVVDDPKLMLVILENIFLALTNSMSSVLYYDRLYKRVQLFPDTFEPKIELFKEKYLGKQGIKEEHIKLIKEVKNLVIEHKKSPIEFRRKGKFVICSKDYEIKTISIEKLKDYLYRGKEFISLTEKIIENGT